MFLTSILLAILNSYYWLYFILIFYLYDLNYDIIYEIQIILMIFVLVVTSSHPVIVSFFSTSKMVLYHYHHFWLLFFVIFICFLLADDCNHSLGSLITSKVIFWVITLLLYIIMTLIGSIVQCHILWWFYSTAMASYHWCHVVLLFFVFFLCFLLADQCDHLLVSLITLEVLFWEVILSLYNKFIFNPGKNIYISISIFCTIPFLGRFRGVALSSGFIPAQLRCITVTIIFEFFAVILFSIIYPASWKANSTFIFFITNDQNRTNIWQGIQFKLNQ